jgi:hypothetical protein
VRVRDTVLFEMLQVGTYLFDDRTGGVYQVTARREIDDLSNPTVILTLNGEYRSADVHLADYDPFPDAASAQANWTNHWNWQALRSKCEQDPGGSACGEWLSTVEDEPQRRFYWVYPPPVEAGRADSGIPIFNGTPPVVDVVIRQQVILPAAS